MATATSAALPHFPTFHSVLPDDARFTCIHPTKKRYRPRCTWPVKWSPDGALATRLKAEILSSTLPRQALVVRLQQFAKLCCCTEAHRWRATELGLLAERWVGELGVDVGGSGLDVPAGEEEGREGEEEALAADIIIPRDSGPPTAGDQPSLDGGGESGTGPQTRSRTVLNPATSLTAPQVAVLPHFFSYESSPDQTLRATVPITLTPTQLEPGTLYVFTRDSDPGFVKIGYTGSTTQRRLSFWQMKCNYVPHLRHEIEDVPCIKRVERLVHIELMEFRRRERFCRHNVENCNVQHEEWFEIEVEIAVLVMDRWARWVREARPYGEDGRLKGEWIAICKGLMKQGRRLDSWTLLEEMHALRAALTALAFVKTKEEVGDELVGGDARDEVVQIKAEDEVENAEATHEVEGGEQKSMVKAVIHDPREQRSSSDEVRRGCEQESAVEVMAASQEAPILNTGIKTKLDVEVKDEVEGEEQKEREDVAKVVTHDPTESNPSNDEARECGEQEGATKNPPDVALKPPDTATDDSLPAMDLGVVELIDTVATAPSHIRQALGSQGTAHMEADVSNAVHGQGPPVRHPAITLGDAGHKVSALQRTRPSEGVST